MRAVLDKYAAMPFRYGTDCCQFAGDCVEAIEGYNPMRRFKYSTEQEANDIIANYGSLEAAVTDVLGEPYDGLKDGDVCLMDANDGTHAVGVIYMGRVVARVKSGLMDYPLERALRVWCT